MIKINNNKERGVFFTAALHILRFLCKMCSIFSLFTLLFLTV